MREMNVEQTSSPAQSQERASPRDAAADADYDDDEYIFDARCAGACGYLLKKTPPARLIDSLREAMDGGAPMSPEVARKVIRLFREITPP